MSAAAKEPSPAVAALAEARLYGILDLAYTDAARALPTATAMIEGGVEILQFRAKTLPPEAALAVAREIAPLCAEAGVPFLINDHPALAKPCGADGAHVGQEDAPVAEARRLAGPGRIIGKSTHSLAQAVAAAEEGADYIGFGPLFATPTKPDYAPIGTAGLIEVHRLVNLPVFCIGGIKLENLGALLDAGAMRVVIVSGILLADDIAGYCRAARALLAASARP